MSRTTPTTTSPLTLALIAACGLLGCAGGCDDEGVVPTRDDREVYVARHNAIATAHNAHTWARPPFLDGTETTPGPADEPYRAAYDACPPEQLAVITPSMPSVLAAMGTAVGRSVEARPLPGACSGAGRFVPDLHGLSDTTCATMAACNEALDAVEEGTRRVDVTSPMSIWDPWTFEGKGKTRSRQGFINLAALTVLRGYKETARTGDRAALIDAIFTSMRFGADLRNGADLGPVITGDLIRQRALDLLRALLAAPDLTPELLERVRRGLVHLAAHPDPWPAAVEANVLVQSSIMLADHEGVAVVPSKQLGRGRAFIAYAGARERRQIDKSLAVLFPSWEALIEKTGESTSYTSRRPLHAAYDQLRRGQQGEWTKHVDPVMLDKYDLYQSTLDAEICVLMLHAAARADPDAPPATIVETRAGEPDVCGKDRVTGLPFVFEAMPGEGRARVNSQAFHTTFTADLPEASRAFVPNLERRFVSSWSLPAPAPPEELPPTSQPASTHDTEGDTP